MAGHLPKRWQNLIRQACPLCNASLEPMPYRESLLRCMNDDACDFVISQTALIRILRDESHVLRLHLTPEELVRLENTVKALTEGMAGVMTTN